MSRGPVVVAEFRSVFGHTVGGPDKTILHGAARHDPARVRIVPCFLVPEGDPVPGLHALAGRAGVEPVIVPDRGRLDPRLPGTLRTLVRRHGCRVLHTHDFKTDFWGPLIRRAAPEVRLMATAHGWSRPGGLKHRFYNGVDLLALRRFPLVLAVSEAVAGRLRRGGVREECIRLLHNGVDLDTWRPPTGTGGRPPGFPERGPVIGMAARLSADKDVETLLAAFERVLPGHPGATLVIVGDGPERGGLETRARRSPASPAIRFLGRRNDLVDLTGAFDIAVLASRGEGLPNSILEAMATERPIVATDVGGVGELVRDGEEGLLVPGGDAAALASALGRVLAEPALARRLAAAARRRVEERFSFADRLRRLEGIYEAVAAGHEVERTGLLPEAKTASAARGDT